MKMFSTILLPILLLLTLVPLFGLDQITPTGIPADITFNPAGGIESFGYLDIQYDSAEHDVIINYNNTLNGPNTSTITFTLKWNSVDNSGTATSITANTDVTIAPNVLATSGAGNKYYLYVEYGAFDQYAQEGGSYTLADNISVTVQNS